MRKLTNEFIEEISLNKTWLRLSGILLCLTASVIILDSMFYYPLASMFSLFVSSVILFTHAFKFWFKKPTGHIMFLSEGLLYLFMTIFFFRHFYLRLYVPLLLICAFFIFGTFRIYTGFSQIFFNKKWSYTILSGVVTVLLSILGMYYFDSLDISLMTLALGLNILFVGVSFIGLGF